MDNLDSALVEAFVSVGTSVDRIATFQESREQFLSCLSAEIRLGADDEQLVWRLFQLRKKGRLPKQPT